jgi:selenocysteine lyase/cysteine desulfurase
LVDGAHTAGQLDLSVIPSLGCDYYTSNLHKWCFAPNSVAFLWMSPSAPSRSALHHPITSHSFGRGINAECAMLGTRDYSAMLSVPFAIDFLDSIGGLATLALRNEQLLQEALTVLSEGWGTSMYVQPHCIRSPSMAMIGCPAVLGDSASDGENLRLNLRSRGIVIQKLFPVPNDRMYMRLSVAIYNTIEEFILLRDAVLSIIEEISSTSIRNGN